MIYLVYGEQELLVNKMIDKIAKDTLSNIDEFNYVVLDAYKHDALQVVSELESFCFSSDKKVNVEHTIEIVIPTEFFDSKSPR